MDNKIFAAMVATTTTATSDSSPIVQPTSVQTAPVVKSDIATKRKKLGSNIFRPNALVSASVYQRIVLGWIVAVVGLWMMLPSIIPSPLRIWDALFMLIREQALVSELLTSLTLNAEAVLVTTVAALLVSYASAIPILKPLSSAVAGGRFMSTVGISIIFTVMIGGGHTLKLALLVVSILTFFVTSMKDVVEQVPQDSLDYVRTLRAGEWRVLWEARVLGTIGQAFDVLRQNAAVGWMMLTMVEGMIRGEGGIGRLLDDQEKHFNLAAMFAIQIVFLSTGALQDLLIRWSKETFAPWSILSYKGKK